MSLTLLPLLIHSEDVPASARDALREASLKPPAERRPYLVTAARALYREANLDCADASELVGL